MNHHTALAARFNRQISRTASAAALCAGLLACGLVAAAPVAFVPPNDASGAVYSTNSNDGWNAGRGIGLSVTSNQTINSVGLLQNLTERDLRYGVYEISSPTGGFSRLQTLRSGGSNVLTSGLAWVDYGFASLTLETGKNYLIEFKFDGTSVENFFYNNQNQAWSQGAFASLEGTLADSFDNSVVGAFRIDGQAAHNVPEPGALALVGTALLGLTLLRRRKAA